MTPIDCVVLAGGLGTRARAFLGDVPKCLAPVRGRPLLAHQLDWLAASGVVGRVVLALGHGAAAVQAYVADPPTDLTLGHFVEHAPRGTANAVRKALGFVTSDPFAILNGDTLLDLDLPAMVAAHRELNAVYTAAVGPDGTHAGLYLLGRSARTYLAWTTQPDLPAYLAMLSSSAPSTFPARGFVDIGTEAGYRAANERNG